MRAASTGGGLIRLVVIWPMVLAALVMTATGASPTSAAVYAATATVTAATATVTAVAATRRTGSQSPSPSPSSPKSSTPPPPPSPAADNATAGTAACELVRVSLREPACTGQISEGPGPPRCPAAIPCARRADNDNNNYNNDNDKKYNNVNYDYNNNNDNDSINNYNNDNDNDNDNNNNNNSSSNHQCLEYARRQLIPAMCPDDPGAYRRPGRLSRYRLRHCCHHTVESVVQQPYADKESCVDQVNKALDMDDIAAAMSCQFNEVLARYDCKQKYSAKSCDSCKDAYALWACAAVLPHWTRTTAKQGRRGRYRVNACRSVCLEAEQKCPWLLPVADDTNPYAGEASFTCIDPDIWFQTSATDVTEQCCYEHCADGLCVRNETLCNGGSGSAADLQRPVCVENVPLDIEESQCTDYSLTDTSSSSRPDLPLHLLLWAASGLALVAMAAVT
ncbi:putative uncharacterized protein DDB_G0277255 [Rhopalosiphum padi]|uniref:putative uncharacterized protein DDB_G0277255 n=1 Tax=Rhopalosiphum padi TaxID=40932 RepID=UPI00298E8A9F|nr:putative uncharacterized protein DDB_G0277255 [Rhopalosiphum padi]